MSQSIECSIVRRYYAGESPLKLARTYQLTNERVFRILRKYRSIVSLDEMVSNAEDDWAAYIPTPEEIRERAAAIRKSRLAKLRAKN